jgi:methionyl-tRNA synthetase
MLDAVRTAIGQVRAGHPPDARYLFFAGYLTPNGELHLGHIGGPYLRSDAAARCLEMYGASVACGTGSDAFESGVTLAAAQSGRGRARDIAAHFTERAALALRRMGIRQDEFINPGQDPVRQQVADACHELAAALRAAGRLTVRQERLLACAPPAPPAATGAFATGACRFCGVAQSGNVCEQCGRWMPPADMTAAWHPGPRPAAPRRASVASVFARTSPGLAAGAMARVLEPGFAYLVRDYPAVFGSWLRVSYPSWWGIPWRVPLAPAPHADSVHSSYVMVKYGSSRVLGARLSGVLGTDPFRAGSGVTTVAAGGLDSAFGWMSLHALTDPAMDFAPFDHIVVNRFMLLRGEKFSTSRKHVIRVNDAMDAGLSPDVLRLLLARSSPGQQESDLVPGQAARQSGRDCATITAALRRAPCRGSGEPEVPAEHAQAAVACLVRQRRSFELPSVDLPAAADALLSWAGRVSEGALDRHPRFARQVLAVLAYPLMPGLARAVWATTGAGPLPGLSDGTAGRRPGADVPGLPPVQAAELASLADRGRLP